MPRFEDNDIINKPFKKKNYRPWNPPDQVNNKEAISEQLVNSNNKQIVDNKQTISKQLVNNRSIYKNNKQTISKPISKQEYLGISKQLVNQLVNKNSLTGPALDAVKKLFGLQRKILFYVTEDCISRGMLTSSCISNETLRMIASTDADSVKTTVQRLIQKGLLTRESGKRGKGGFSSFTISESIRNAVIEEKRQLNIGKQLVNQLVNDNSSHLVNNRITNKETTSFSSSSNIKTTTIELEEAYQQLDLEPLQGIGFRLLHVEQLAKKGIHPDIIQESIHHFAYALGRKNYDDPLNVFMGVLRRGQRWHEANYESPQDRALRELIEAKKAEKDKRESMINQLVELEFPDWLKTLAEEERRTIVPANVTLQAAATSLLRKHFIDQVLLPRLGLSQR